MVNDGRHTVMYVEGCETVDNPPTMAVGLTQLALPWALGGYGYGGTINQVFNGWIGDVRIVQPAAARRRVHDRRLGPGLALRASAQGEGSTPKRRVTVGSSPAAARRSGSVISRSTAGPAAELKSTGGGLPVAPAASQARKSAGTSAPPPRARRAVLGSLQGLTKEQIEACRTAIRGPTWSAPRTRWYSWLMSRFHSTRCRYSAPSIRLKQSSSPHSTRMARSLRRMASALSRSRATTWLPRSPAGCPASRQQFAQHPERVARPT